MAVLLIYVLCNEIDADVDASVLWAWLVGELGTGPSLASSKWSEMK